MTKTKETMFYFLLNGKEIAKSNSRPLALIKGFEIERPVFSARIKLSHGINKVIDKSGTWSVEEVLDDSLAQG